MVDGGCKEAVGRLLQLKYDSRQVVGGRAGTMSEGGDKVVARLLTVLSWAVGGFVDRVESESSRALGDASGMSTLFYPMVHTFPTLTPHFLRTALHRRCCTWSTATSKEPGSCIQQTAIRSNRDSSTPTTATHAAPNTPKLTTAITTIMTAIVPARGVGTKAYVPPTLLHTGAPTPRACPCSSCTWGDARWGLRRPLATWRMAAAAVMTLCIGF